MKPEVLKNYLERNIHFADRVMVQVIPSYGKPFLAQIVGYQAVAFEDKDETTIAHPRTHADSDKVPGEENRILGIVLNIMVDRKVER